MPFARPTLTQLRSQAASDIATSLPGADALLRFNNLGALGKVLAKMSNGHYGYLDFIALQTNPFTATDEYLQAWGALKKVFLKGAEQAAGSNAVTYSGPNGTLIPSGTLLVRGDGAEFTTTADATISSGTAVLSAIASLAGSDGNCDIGMVLTLGTPIPGVLSDGTVTALITGGADIEEQEAFRSRVLEQWAFPPQGGDQTDYIEWALSVAGVTRAWSLPNGMGPGTVIVYTMFDVAESLHNGFPQGTDGCATGETRDTPATGDKLAVANYIFTVQPVTALIYSVAPTANTVDFTISGIAGASSATKASIATAIDAVFLREGGPGGTFDGQRVEQGKVDLSFIESAITVIPGTTGFVITAIACSSGSVVPATVGNIVSNTGALPVRGTITYV